MSIFKGKNDVKSTVNLTSFRSDYDFLSFPENNSLGPEQVKDLRFAERVLYGKVDTNLDTVVPRQELMAKFRYL